MTSEERIAALHTRMTALRKKRERRKTAALGAGCGLLTACLVLLVFSGGADLGGGKMIPGTAGLYSGAALLFADAGGYVAVAAAAFMVGVIITALCIRYRKEHGAEDQTETEWRETK